MKYIAVLDRMLNMLIKKEPTDEKAGRFYG